MPRIECFEDCLAWQRARELRGAVYDCSRSGGFAGNYNLRDQIRNAALSTMSNIAEGFERDGDREFLQFLSIAKGACGEVRSQLYAALDERYIDRTTFDAVAGLALETSRLIARLADYLRRSEKRGRKFR